MLSDAQRPSQESNIAEALELERRIGRLTSLALCSVGLALALTAPPAGRYLWLAGLGIYMGVVILAGALGAVRWLVSVAGPHLMLIGVLVDLGFVTWLIYLDGGAVNGLFLLYVLLLLKAVLLYPSLPQALALSFLFAPLYAGALFVSAGSLYFLQTKAFLVPYALLFVLAIAGVYVASALRQQGERIGRLHDVLGQKSVDLERKTLVLQRTASDLSERVIELRSLQEGIKAISSALALEDVLRLIVENASQVLEGRPCYVAVREDSGQINLITTRLAGLGRNRVPLPGYLRELEETAEQIMRTAEPVALSSLPAAGGSSRSEALGAPALLGAPLLVDGEAIGALMATSLTGRPFVSEQLSLLAAFADQAALAVKNARLYRDLAGEQRRTEEKSNELEAIVRGIGDGVIVTDPEQRLLLINPRAAHIFGLSAMPAVNRPLNQVIRNDDLIALLEETLTATEGVGMREIALPPVRDKVAVYQALAARLQVREAKSAGIVTVLRDITGQKELERMKSNFLSVISHELKTPLHSIKGFVDIILMGKTGSINEIQRDFLGTVKEQTTQLQRLISDLIEFSRLESGQIKLHIEDLSVRALAGQVIDKLSPLAVEGNVDLRCDLPADFPHVEADRMRMEQVFSNIIDNAIKFTPVGGCITIGGEEQADHVWVRIRDTGIGIPVEERQRIFDRFYQVDGGSTRSYRGTGLGLTICKHIVEQHRGRIWVEGSEGDGATFVIVLPKRLAGEEELALDFSSLPSRVSSATADTGESRD